MRYICVLLLVFVFLSCKESDRSRISGLVKEWEGKAIVFPEKIVFTKYGIDTLDYQMPESDYFIVSYIDSMGCTSCKLQFHKWESVMNEMDSVLGKHIPFLFMFHPKNKKDLSELNYLMKRDKFDYPVWIDTEDTFNKQNQLPSEDAFHSFLINNQCKVVAIGNPFRNPKVRELYLKIISGGDKQKSSLQSNITSIDVKKTVLDLGEFDYTVPQEVVFTLRNSGKERLVINDIVSSCGCISVDYLRSPIEPEKEISIRVVYKAEKPEYVNKTLTIYANIESPLKVMIRGNAH